MENHSAKGWSTSSKTVINKGVVNKVCLALGELIFLIDIPKRKEKERKGKEKETKRREKERKRTERKARQTCTILKTIHFIHVLKLFEGVD